MNFTHNEMVVKINDLLGYISKDKKKSTEMISLLKSKKGMVVGASAIVLMQRPVSDLTIEEMYWVVDVAECMKDDIPEALRLTVAKVFTPKEIQQYKESRFVYKEIEIYPVVFDNLLKVSEDQWLGVMNTQTIFDLYKKQVINYNAKTQRPLKRVTKDGVINYVISKNVAAVNEIKDLLSKGLFIPNCLTFNLNDDNPELDFSEAGNKVVLKGGSVDLTDGFHRYNAIIEIMLEQPDFNINFGFWLTNFSEEKANRYIYQEDKRNQIDKQYVEANQVTGFAQKIAQKINETVDSPYYGDFVRYNKKLINYDECLIVMNKTIICSSRKEINDISASYINTMNELYDKDIDLAGKTIGFQQVYFIGLWLIHTGEITIENLEKKLRKFIPKRRLSITSGIKYLKEV